MGNAEQQSRTDGRDIVEKKGLTRANFFRRDIEPEAFKDAVQVELREVLSEIGNLENVDKDGAEAQQLVEEVSEAVANRMEGKYGAAFREARRKFLYQISLIIGVFFLNLGFNLESYFGQEQESLSNFSKLPKQLMSDEFKDTLAHPEILAFMTRNPDEYAGQEIIITPEQYPIFKQFADFDLTELDDLLEEHRDKVTVKAIIQCDEEGRLYITSPVVRTRADIPNRYAANTTLSITENGEIKSLTPGELVNPTQVTFIVYGESTESVFDNLRERFPQLAVAIDNLDVGDMVMVEASPDNALVKLRLIDDEFVVAQMPVGAGARMRREPSTSGELVTNNNQEVKSDETTTFVTTKETTLEQVQASSGKVVQESNKGQIFYDDGTYEWYYLDHHNEKVWSGNISSESINGADFVPVAPVEPTGVITPTATPEEPNPNATEAAATPEGAGTRNIYPVEKREEEDDVSYWPFEIDFENFVAKNVNIGNGLVAVGLLEVTLPDGLVRSNERGPVSFYIPAAIQKEDTLEIVLMTESVARPISRIPNPNFSLDQLQQQLTDRTGQETDLTSGEKRRSDFKIGLANDIANVQTNVVYLLREYISQTYTEEQLAQFADTGDISLVSKNVVDRDSGEQLPHPLIVPFAFQFQLQ